MNNKEFYNEENFWFVNGKKVPVSPQVYAILKNTYSKEREIDNGIHTKKESEENIYFTSLDEHQGTDTLDDMEHEILIKMLIQQLLSNLNENERLVIKRYFFDGATLAEIQHELLCSLITVKRIKKRALDKMKEKAKKLGIDSMDFFLSNF